MMKSVEVRTHFIKVPVSLLMTLSRSLNMLGVGMEESSMWIDSDWGLCAEIE